MFYSSNSSKMICCNVTSHEIHSLVLPHPTPNQSMLVSSIILCRTQPPPLTSSTPEKYDCNVLCWLWFLKPAPMTLNEVILLGMCTSLTCGTTGASAMAKDNLHILITSLNRVLIYPVHEVKIETK